VAFGVFVGDRQQYRLLDRCDLISAKFADVTDCALAHADASSDETIIDARAFSGKLYSNSLNSIPMK
jgi:hypothetical protein